MATAGTAKQSGDELVSVHFPSVLRALKRRRACVIGDHFLYAMTTHDTMRDQGPRDRFMSIILIKIKV